MVVDFGFTSKGLQLTEADIAAEESKTFGSKFMEQGVHSVKIIEAGWHENKETKSTACRGDGTWHNLKVVYENAAGQIYNHYVQVPTSKLTYTIQGKKGPQESAFMFVKFKAFCAGIGEIASPDAKLLTALMKKFFADPKKLIDKTLEITLSYKGCYLQYVEGAGKEATYSIMNPDGTILDAGPYTRPVAVKEAVVKFKKTISDLELSQITSKIVEVEEIEADETTTDPEKW